MKAFYPLTMLTEIDNVQQSGYYKWINTKETRQERKEQDQLLKKHMMAIHQEAFGHSRITTALRQEGLIVNNKRVYRLMIFSQLFEKNAATLCAWNHSPLV